MVSVRPLNYSGTTYLSTEPVSLVINVLSASSMELGENLVFLLSMLAVTTGYDLKISKANIELVWKLNRTFVEGNFNHVKSMCACACSNRKGTCNFSENRPNMLFQIINIQNNAHINFALYGQKSSSLSLPFFIIIVEITTGLTCNSHL